MFRPVTLADDFFPGFDVFDATLGDARLRVRQGGAGPALLLLHGYPQTHVMWRLVARRLAQRFRVVVADLRGYGDSFKPASAPDHAPYSKRAMAGDMIALMDALGHERFFLAGHDRGGRVAHRLAMDVPTRVRKLATLDIAPTREMYANADDAFARAYWHWFFLIQPAPFPERLIGADPDFYWLRKSSTGTPDPSLFSPDALAEYLRCFRDPAAIHASCEDYRAAATIDIVHDDADGDARLPMPVLSICGARGAVHRCFDVEALWRKRAQDVRATTLPGGHYLAEELPAETAALLADFFLSD